MRVCLQAYFGCASAPDGTIYAAGGHDGTSFLSSCEAYNPTTDKWRTIASMGAPRAYFGLQYLHGRLYAIGGHNGDARISTCEAYDPTTDTWAPIASLHSPRAFLGTASTGKAMYALGGSDAPGHALSSCEVYEPEVGAWRVLTRPMSEARCFPGAAFA